MKSLPHKLRKNGFDYTLVQREGKCYIYRQTVTEKTHYYEVFQVQVRPEQTFKGKFYPEHEVFPADSNFGRSAWSYYSLKRAKERFDLLVQKEKKSQNNFDSS